MRPEDLRGSIPAAILPMGPSLEPDFAAYARYLEWLIGEGAIALAINMDTGEGPQLTEAERRQAAEVAVGVSRGRRPILAGLMGSTTAAAVATAKMYRAAGVDGLVVFPNAAFRNEPLDPDIPYDFHRALADEAGLPLVLFQLAPVFGGVLFTREVLLRLIEIPLVVAIKEASFDAARFARTKDILAEGVRPIILLTGNDRFVTESILLGAQGALLGFASVGCRLVAAMLRHFTGGDYAQGVALRGQLQGLADFLYRDPVLDYRARCKAALAHLGVLRPDQIYVRPPLQTVRGDEFAEIGQALARAQMRAAERAPTEVASVPR